MTKSQINKVGDKLRAPGLPNEDTLRRLQEIRSLYELHRLQIKRVRARLRQQSKTVRSILAGIAVD